MAFTVQDAPNPEGVMQNLNTYHRKYSKEIWARITSALKAETFMSAYMDVKDQFTISQAMISNIIKKFACEFEPGGDVTITPKILNVRRMKADIELCCMDELWNSYLAEMYDLGIDNYTPVRFIQWIFESLIEPKIIEELEYASVSGWYEAAPITSDYTNVVDGIATLVERSVNNGGDVNVIPTGAILAGTAMNQVEDFLRAIPKKVRKNGQDGVLWVSEEVHSKFYLDRRSELGGNTDYTAIKNGNDLTLVDDYTRIKIECFEGLAGSDLMFYTPKWNVRKLYNTLDVAKGGNWSTDRQDRCIHAMKDWMRGYGFIFDDYIYANDQELHGALNV